MMKRWSCWMAMFAAGVFVVTSACGGDSGSDDSGADNGDTAVADGMSDAGETPDTVTVDTGEAPNDTESSDSNGMGATGRFSALALGKTFTCGILNEDGSIECWGNDLVGQTNPPEGTFSEIAAGQDYACALTEAEGTVECWGVNDTTSAAITDPPSGSYRAISAGEDYACVLDDQDEVECWKKQDFAPENGFTSSPDGTFKTIDVSPVEPACGITTDDTIQCWNDRKVRNPPEGTFTDVGTGPDYACALADDGTLSCWGSKRNLYADNEPGGAFRQIDGNGGHMCGITEGGSIECWGTDAANDEGQLDAPQGNSFRRVVTGAGSKHNCAFDDTDDATCWGWDMFGQATIP